MSQPGIAIYALSRDPKIMRAAMRVVMSFHRAFYYSPRSNTLRIRIRSEHIRNAITSELKEVGMIVRIKYE